MRHKLTILTICGLAIAYLTASQIEQRLSAQPEAAVQKAQVADRTPPDIKEGVKISFAGAKAGAGVNGGEPATVVRIQGNWVYLKGEDLGLDKSGEREGWVNFDTVGWYKVAKK